jgi:hypothetical protein
MTRVEYSDGHEFDTAFLKRAYVVVLLTHDHFRGAI